MQNDKKEPLLKVVLIEFSIIAFLVIIISAILNYFSILPLSNTFSFLSFLPKQKLFNQKINNNPNLTLETNKPQVKPNAFSKFSVVIPSKPQIITNPDDKYIFRVINGSYYKILPNVEMKIDVEIETLTNGKSDETTGLIFADDLKKTNAKSLFLFYYQKTKTWGLRYKHGNTTKYLPISEDITPQPSFKATFYIDANGKEIYSVLSNGAKKALILPESMYEETRVINAIAQVSPLATLKINSLNYIQNKEK